MQKDATDFMEKNRKTVELGLTEIRRFYHFIKKQGCEWGGESYHATHLSDGYRIW